MTRSLQTPSPETCHCLCRLLFSPGLFEGPLLALVQLGAAGAWGHRPRCRCTLVGGASGASPSYAEQLLVHRAPKSMKHPQLSKKALCKWKEPWTRALHLSLEKRSPLEQSYVNSRFLETSESLPGQAWRTDLPGRDSSPNVALAPAHRPPSLSGEATPGEDLFQNKRLPPRRSQWVEMLLLVCRSAQATLSGPSASQPWVFPCLSKSITKAPPLTCGHSPQSRVTALPEKRTAPAVVRA